MTTQRRQQEKRAARTHKFVPITMHIGSVLGKAWVLVRFVLAGFGFFPSLILHWRRDGIGKRLLTNFLLPPEAQQQHHYSKMRLHFCIYFISPRESRNICFQLCGIQSFTLNFHPVLFLHEKQLDLNCYHHGRPAMLYLQRSTSLFTRTSIRLRVG